MTKIDFDEPSICQVNTPEHTAALKIIAQGKAAMSVIGETTSDDGGAGVVGSSKNWKGVFGVSQTNDGVLGESETAAGVMGKSKRWVGVRGESNGPLDVNANIVGVGVLGESTEKGGIGVLGEAKHQEGGAGVMGKSKTWLGVYGESETGHGVWGETKTDTGGAGVVGKSKNWVGVHGESQTKFGILGKGPIAGRFEGDVEVTGDIKLVNADCAEDFDVADSEENIEAGTVMVLNEMGSLQPSYQEYDKKVAGVISGAGGYKPGIVFDTHHREEEQEQESDDDAVRRRMPVALVGKVYCKVDATLSAIEVGDLLTTSSMEGHAMKAEDPMRAFGAVIGKALSSLSEGRMGMIPVLVALQ